MIKTDIISILKILSEKHLQLQLIMQAENLSVCPISSQDWN